MLAALAGTGLSAAAGLNAFIPFVLVGMLDRFTTLVELPASMDWISSWWAIGIGMLLLVGDVVLDKVPGVDHVSDAIQTAVRPLMGGVMFAAVSGAEQIEQSGWWRDNPWVGAVIGVAVAGAVHAGKALSRPMVNAGTLGLGTPLVSAGEDVASASVSVIAILAPILVIGVLLVIGYVLFRIFRFHRRWRAAPERLAKGAPGTGPSPPTSGKT